MCFIPSRPFAFHRLERVFHSGLFLSIIIFILQGLAWWRPSLLPLPLVIFAIIFCCSFFFDLLSWRETKVVLVLFKFLLWQGCLLGIFFFFFLHFWHGDTLVSYILISHLPLRGSSQGRWSWLVSGLVLAKRKCVVSQRKMLRGCGYLCGFISGLMFKLCIAI